MYSDKPHTNVIKRGDTPRFWRLFLSAIMMRYGIIESVKFARDALFWKTEEKMEWLKQHVDATAKPIVNPPEGHDLSKPWDALKDGIKRYGLNEDPEHISKAYKTIRGPLTFTQEHVDASADLRAFDDHVKANIRASERTKFDTLTDRISDSMNGMLSIGITLNNIREVYTNIRRLFREAVAYDLNKAPQKVTFGDLFHSKNTLVKRTFRNLLTYSFWRFASDALFFTRWLLPGVNGSYAGIGAKGVLLTAELLSNRYTFYERLVDFSTNRLDVANGAGKNITGDDLASLYQGAAFENSAIVSLDGPEGPVRQRNSAPLFTRMAGLMQKSYLKSSRNVQPSNGRDLLGDFELPEFLFLLGNGYLDASNPRLSLAYVEVANAHGIDAAKKMRQMIGQGASIAQCFEAFPVAPDILRNQPLLGMQASEHAHEAEPVTKDHAAQVRKTQIPVHSAAEKFSRAPAAELAPGFTR